MGAGRSSPGRPKGENVPPCICDALRVTTLNLFWASVLVRGTSCIAAKTNTAGMNHPPIRLSTLNMCIRSSPERERDC
ncbi:hypothetical protein BDW42DRAFT_164964, partial [Aspergillus taichungensis]